MNVFTFLAYHNPHLSLPETFAVYQSEDIIIITNMEINIICYEVACLSIP